jgi:hypothetical protein
VVARGVEVVVVGSEPRLSEALRLLVAQHAQRRTGFHAEPAHAGDHRQHLLEVLAARVAPGRAHAEARRAVVSGEPRLFKHGFYAHQLLGRDTRLVVCALGTVRTIFGATTGLDREQRAELHRTRLVVAAMDLLSAEHQLDERRIVEVARFAQGPVVTCRLHRRCD